MSWQEDVENAAEWAWEQWTGLDPSTRRALLLELGSYFSPIIDSYLTLEELNDKITEYANDPIQICHNFLDYMVPGSRYAELGRSLSPDIERRRDYEELLRRPVILIPGMTGTRLMTPEGTTVPRTSGQLPPDELRNLVEMLLRSSDSPLLRELPQSVRNTLAPILNRVSDRHLWNPRTVWDPDTGYAMFDIVNKTATERGALFCPDVTPAEPARDFAAVVAESMSVENFFTLLLGPVMGRNAPRFLREAAALAGREDVRSWLEDRQFQELRDRRRRRGWGQTVWGISKDWLLTLERHFGEVVYVYGYDWRRPLEDSVSSLHERIEEVRQDFERRYGQDRTPILVTHSFGGLLARAAARDEPSSIAGIVQIFSPTAGAIKPYTYFKKGGGATIPPYWDSETPTDRVLLSQLFDSRALSLYPDVQSGNLFQDPFFALILGWDSIAFAATSAGTYGLYSLLPNNNRRYRQDPVPWLQIENDPALRLNASAVLALNVFDIYRQFDMPWGLLDGSVWNSSGGISTGDQSERAFEAIFEMLNDFEGEAGTLARLLHAGQKDGWLRLFTRETLSAEQAREIIERGRRGIDAAERLDERVGDFIHPNTWTVYGTGKHTDSGFNIRRQYGPTSNSEPYPMHRIVSQEGDGTLEASSARAQSRGTQREFHLVGVSHASLMTESPIMPTEETRAAAQAARAVMCKSVYLAMLAAHRAEQAASSSTGTP